MDNRTKELIVAAIQEGRLSPSAGQWSASEQGEVIAAVQAAETYNDLVAALTNTSGYAPSFAPVEAEAALREIAPEATAATGIASERNYVKPSTLANAMSTFANQTPNVNYIEDTERGPTLVYVDEEKGELRLVKWAWQNGELVVNPDDEGSFLEEGAVDVDINFAGEATITAESAVPDTPDTFDVDYIGVPQDYMFRPDTPTIHPSIVTRRDGKQIIPGRDYTDPEGAGPTVAPRYERYDDWRHFVGKSPTYIAGVQKRLIDAGFLNTDQVKTPGFWSSTEINAMNQVMTYANQQGKNWLEVLDEWEEIKANNPDLWSDGREDNRLPFVAPAYRAPDYATLNQAVKGTMRQQLGRDPKDWEMALLADNMSANYRKAYDSDVQAARNEYNATGRAIRSDASQTAASVGNVDPAARFLEHFETRYAPEIGHVEDVQETFQNQTLLFRSLAGLDSMVRR